MLAIADTMAAHARLTSVLLAVNDHGEEVDWPTRAAGECNDFANVCWCSLEKLRVREGVEKWKLRVAG